MPDVSAHIVFPLFEGVTQLDFTGPHQVFSRAPGARIAVASMGGHDIQAEGLVFSGLADLRRVEQCDLLCVPGGSGTSAAMVDEDFMREIRRLAGLARYHTSVCTGAFILGAAGLLHGRRATSHWALRDLLKPFGAEVETGRVVRDGNLITGGGVTAGLDFALAVAGEIFGRDTAEAIQLRLEYAPAPPFDAGRPESAPPELIARLRDGLNAELIATRRAVEAVLARLEEA